MKCFLSILLLFLFFNAQGQTIGDSNSTYQRMFETVSMDQVKGKWQNVDSAQYVIDFQLINGSFMLGAAYHFSIKDTAHIVAVGVLSRWPPAYCYIQKVDKDQLELEFSGVARKNPLVYRFRRVK